CFRDNKDKPPVGMRLSHCMHQTLSSHSSTRLHRGGILFPYTTLFRSRSQQRDCCDASRAGERSMTVQRFFLNLRPFYPEDALAIDRKSTRLNSSHVKISYAVFCLKKKNNGRVNH